MKGAQSVDEYLKETAIVNPHVLITYVNPKAEQIIFESNVDMEYSGIVRTTIYYILPTTKKNVLLHFLIQFNVLCLSNET